MTKPKPAATAPTHLTAASKRLFGRIAGEYELQAQHVELLTLACEARDRAEQARKAIAKDGPYMSDRYGGLKAHPAIAVERDSRLAFGRLLRQLDLDDDPTSGG